MIKGIGVDMTSVDEVERLLHVCGNAFINRTFTLKEIRTAEKSENSIEYFATRYAAKEAVFKAIAPSVEEPFDFRIVETLNQKDGCPFVNTNNELGQILKKAGIEEILISITTESRFVIAFVIGQSAEG